MVTPERLTEPRVTMKRLLAKPRNFSNLPAFQDLNGRPFYAVLVRTYRIFSMKFLLKISLKRRFWMTFKRFENRVNSDIESVSRRNVKSGAETGPQL